MNKNGALKTTKLPADFLTICFFTKGYWQKFTFILPMKMKNEVQFAKKKKALLFRTLYRILKRKKLYGL